MQTVLQDFRFALRQLRRNPGFTAAAVLTLALGIGATTAVFSGLNAVVLNPLPYPDGHRVVNVGWQWAGEGQTSAITTTKFTFVRDRVDVFEAVATYATFTADVETAAGLREASAMRASEDLFQVLGWDMAIGRGFTAGEDRPGGAAVAVIGHRVWQEQYGATHDVLGRMVRVDGDPHTIVGVAHPELRLAQSPTPPDVIVPFRLVSDPQDTGHNTTAIARIREGVDRAAVHAALQRATHELRAENPTQAGAAERGFATFSFQDIYVGGAASILWILLGAAGFVLLIGCVNLANLLLARASERRRELGVRAAIGAGRGRIVQQLVTESFVLAAIGGAFGLLLAIWAAGIIVGLAPAAVPRIDEVGLDLRVLGFAFGVTLLAGLAFGLAGALPATRGDLTRAIRDGAAGTGGRGKGVVRSALVVGEVALTVVLLTGAGLLAATFLLLRSVELGFDPEGVSVVAFSRAPADLTTPAALWSFQTEALGRLRAIPGVAAVGAANVAPLAGQYNIPITIAGRPEATEPAAQWRAITPGYLEALGRPLVRGRDITAADGPAGPNVALVNETFARHYFPDRDPIGERVQVAMMGGQPIHPEFEPREAEIVGVVADAREFGPDGPVLNTVYVPQPQASARMTSMPVFLVRTVDRRDRSAEIAAALGAVDSRLALPGVTPMEDLAGTMVAGQRFTAVLASSFAGLALLLTAVGIYGVLAYTVRLRTREVAIRMALGARATRVVRAVVARGVGLVVVGLVIGLAGALVVTRLIGGFLYGVEPADPVTLMGVTLLLLATAGLAVYLPARRAARVDPMIALRAE
jgi:putative ABC transport system permease protein